MKKIYIEAELEIVNLLSADIITTSGGNSDEYFGETEGDNGVGAENW